MSRTHSLPGVPADRTTRGGVRRLAKAVVRSSSTAVLRVVGVEAPSELLEGSCLVLAPHPDDETFGCGATIARTRAAGHRVDVVIVADGSRAPHQASLSPAEYVAVRREEAITALARLGVGDDHVTFLGFEDGTLTEHAADVAGAVAATTRSTSARTVLVTSVMDRHPDHAALGEVARSLLERGDITGQLYEFPIWQRVPAASLTRGALRSVGTRHREAGLGRRAALAQVRPRLVATGGHLDAKRDAIAAYQSQLPVLPLGFVEDFLQPYEFFVPVPKA